MNNKIYVYKKVYDKIIKEKQLKRKNIVIKTFKKNFVILKEYIDVLFKVYDGRRFVKVFITPDHIGRNIGSFVLTRKHGRHTLVTKASRQKIKK